MTTAATTLRRPSPDAGAAVGARPVIQSRVIRSEWIKIRTLRSTVITLGLTLVGVIGIATLVGHVMNNNWTNMGPFDHTPEALIEHLLGVGVNLGQLAVGILGVLFATSEYAHGMIRATFGAVPRRLPVLWAKVVVFAGVVFSVGFVAALGAFFAGMAMLGSHGVSISYPGAWRAVLGATLYLTVVGLLGLGLGFIIRSTAGGIAALFGLLLILPGVVALLPGNWQAHITRYLPIAAGQTLYMLRPEGPSMGPWTGFALFCGYAAAAIALAALSLRYRDA